MKKEKTPHRNLQRQVNIIIKSVCKIAAVTMMFAIIFAHTELKWNIFRNNKHLLFYGRFFAVVFFLVQVWIISVNYQCKRADFLSIYGPSH